MKQFFAKVWRIFWKVSLALFAASLFFVVLFKFVPVPLTPLMIIRCVQQKTDGKEMKLKKDWQSYENISSDLTLAVVSSEDNNFMSHSGFDFQAIEKAMKYNEKKKGKKVRGASTISQQTAKNVFLWPGRSYIRKAFEVYFTVLIEFIWGKERIMEVYLNVIEMGDGIYGAEAASQMYFNHSAKKLTKYESAQIAAILPNPRKWSPVKPSGYLSKRTAWILWNMNNIEQVKFE